MKSTNGVATTKQDTIEYDLSRLKWGANFGKCGANNQLCAIKDFDQTVRKLAATINVDKEN